MPKMARNRSALHDVLAQGASYRDITVITHPCPKIHQRFNFTIKFSAWMSNQIPLSYVDVFTNAGHTLNIG